MREHQVVWASELNDATLPIRFFSAKSVDLVVEVAYLELSESRVLNLRDLPGYDGGKRDREKGRRTFLVMTPTICLLHFSASGRDSTIVAE